MYLRNVNPRYKKSLENEISVYVITDASFYTATLALLIDEYPELIGTYGSLVCIPHRQLIACYPVEDIQVLKAIDQLMPIVDQLFREGPGSISPHIYWFQDGGYSAISYEIQSKKIYFPPDVVKVLNQLAQ